VALDALLGEVAVPHALLGLGNCVEREEGGRKSEGAEG
jgi:hypothetical protein